MKVTPTKTCPVCKGEGIIVEDVEDVALDFTRIYTCHRCFGRGVVIHLEVVS